MKCRLVLAACLLAAWPAHAADRYFGADLSFANEMDDCGAVFRENGKPVDVYKIFKDHGANLIRIRIWNDASWTDYSNLADVEKSIARAKAAGMQVLLDFHYSDDWADGEKQIIPVAWAGIKDPHKLADALYQYTYKTLMALNARGLMPDMVQVGNEINREILEPKGWPKDTPIDWTRDALLINAGIRAVRDAGQHSSIQPKVMLHIAQPENVEPWFAAATKAGITDFDVIGISYYEKWSKEPMSGLGATIARLTKAYPKAKVMVVETAYPWTMGWADNSPNNMGQDFDHARLPRDACRSEEIPDRSIADRHREWRRRRRLLGAGLGLDTLPHPVGQGLALGECHPVRFPGQCHARDRFHGSHLHATGEIAGALRYRGAAWRLVPSLLPFHSPARPIRR